LPICAVILSKKLPAEAWGASSVKKVLLAKSSIFDVNVENFPVSVKALLEKI
jgi:hypothetical protein